MHTEQKRAIIDRYINDRETYLQISATTEISKSAFYTWIKQYKSGQEKLKNNRSVIAISHR